MYLVLKLSKILLPGVLLDLQLLLDVHLLFIIHQEILVVLENISQTGQDTGVLSAHLLLSILLFIFWPLLLEKSPETPGAEDCSGEDQD